MKRSVVFSVLSKPPRFGRGIMVNSCCTRSVKVNTNVLIARNLLQIRNRQKHPFTPVEQLKYFYSSDLAQRSDESDSDVECSKDSYIDSDTEDSSLENRKLLFPDTHDPIILKLNECASVQAVFDIVSEQENEFKGDQACQALLVLWELQKIYYRINKETRYGPDDLEVPVKKIVNEYSKRVVSHPCFGKIAHYIEVSVNELLPLSLTCSFLYLKKMGIPLHSSVMQKLLMRIEELLDTMGSDFSLPALSRFTVTIKEPFSLIFLSSAQKVLPLILEKIDSCESEHDFELLSVCFQSISWLISSTTFNAYKCKVEKLISSGIFPFYKTSLLVRTASILNNPLWCNETYTLSKNILMLLKGRLSEMKISDVLRVHKIIESQLEPADLYSELSEHTSHLLSEEEGFTTVENESAELLASVVSFCSPKKRKTFESITKNYLNQKLNPQILASLFKILRYLKTSNVELYNKFWSSTLQVMKENPEECSYSNILKYSNRYMYFNNNLGGTYRHHEFENQLFEWYLNLYDTDLIGFIPSKFSQMIGFLVAYVDKQKHFLNKLDIMITRLGEMSFQLSAFDCAYISRGIQISFHLSKTHEKPQMYDIYVKLNSILNECIRRHLKNMDAELSITNTLMRSYVIRNAPQTTDISHCLVNRYENFKGSISSRLLREAVRSFLTSKCLIPKIIDNLTEFIAENKTQLFGETVELTLTACYELGYTPVNVDSFLKASSEVILRDSDRLPGLAMLQSSLALCFFHSLPEELVHHIFTIDFLERLDEEIANCYAKATYPSRVRNYLMQLNRAVCLDYPEFDVPWFHKKYCEEIAATEEVSTSLFYNEVKEVLVDVLGERKFISQYSYSPYGYRLDFEIFFNENNIPVSWKQRSDKNIFRKAILLHAYEAFSNNVISLNGFSRMKKRHLEMLGYEVIEVVQTVWNSMYMAEPGMKHNFIKEKVFNNEREAVFRQI